MTASPAVTVHVVTAIRAGETEYWAVASSRDEAVALVQSKIGPLWKAYLSARRLTADQIAVLNVRLGEKSVHKLDYAP